MKRAFYSFLFLALMVISASAQSISYSNSVLYQPVTLATNTGSSVIIGSATIQGRSIQNQVTHGALASNTNLPTIFQISIDNANWSSIQTNNPSSTNSGAIDAWPISMGSFTVYARAVQINTTTNVQSAGATIVLVNGLLQ